ncbi:META domain-containing protein [Marinobacter sp. M1N3S26]|uniref:META domain-containing protein n=1 Tax=Marinobacter sp. M1N3S26 TaxID=3382299 RepID=UPI00387B9A0C
MTNTRSLVGSLLISIPALAMVGCAGWFGGTEEAPSTPPMLDGTVWQVEDVDKGGIIDNSMITVAFNDGRVTGYTGCNRYFGSYETAGASITVRELASTLKACVPAISAQEQRFLHGLRGATSYRMESDTWLLIIDDKERTRLKMIQIDEDPTAGDAASAQPQAQDMSPVKSVVHFECEGMGPMDLYFTGDETLTISMGDRSETLQRSVTASGARYVNDSVTLWNKAPEAMLEVDGISYTCRRDD